MNIKETIKTLLMSDISNYKISKEVGIAQTTLGDYTTGKSKLGNMKLDHAMKLYDYYTKNKGEIEMKTLNYKGLDLEDRQVDVELRVKSFDEVLRQYESMKYSDTDFENRPGEEDMTNELAKDLGWYLEEALQDDDKTIVFGYVNKDTQADQRIEFDFNVIYESKTGLTVEIDYKDRF